MPCATVAIRKSVGTANDAPLLPQVERLTLEVEWAGHPSLAARDQRAASGQAVWKPSPVAMWLPAETPATQVSHRR